MKVARYMKEDILIQKSIEALVEKIGPVEAVRFLNIPKEKRIESVKRHLEWQKGLVQKRFFDEIFK